MGRTDDAANKALAEKLRKHTSGEVLFDIASRGRYATDASIYQIMPVGVFVPRTNEDVQTAIAIARELNVPVLPRGGGTSQCGQTTGAALVVDSSKYFRSVLQLNVDEATVRVEPGLVLDDLNAQLKEHGLWYPVDVSTSAQATLGGMAGNNSCGSRSIAYGNMVHNVLGVEGWLSDGQQIEFGPIAGLGGRALALGQFVRDLALMHRAAIEERWPKVMRRVAGYNLDVFHNQSERPYTADGQVNLAHLLVGSEGTLVYTKALTLKLAPLARGRVLGVVNFDDFHAAMDAAQHLVKLKPSAVELVDRTMIELSLSNPSFRPTIAAALIGRPAAILLVEFSGDDKAALAAKLKDLVALMGDLGRPGCVVEMSNEIAQKSLWEVRKAGLNIMMSLKGDGKPVSFIEDCAVPLEHLAAYTDALTEVFERHGTRGTWYAHASVGTLHVRPILDMRRSGPEGGATKMRAIAEEAAALVQRFRGAYSGEHGDGLCRGEWIEWQFGPAINSAFRAIKEKFDPIGLFNPGKIIDPPKMDDGALFRFPPACAPNPYRTIELKPVFDWSAWDVMADPITEETSPPGTGGDSTHGFAKAVEMCNNNGHCRKFDAGAMCPSFRVTRDEQHLTRGRANTLRLALSNQLGPEAFTSPAMHDSMSLCVGCKACKRECPTGIDMARMKLEFLAHYKSRHGFTLRDQLIGNLPAYARKAGRIHLLLNLGSTLPGARWVAEKLLGLSARRRLPQWRSDSFWQKSPPAAYVSDQEETLAVARQGGKSAVLFVDTFTGTFETENALAALRVLKAAGYTVHALSKLDSQLCCGRTYLAAGMAARARIEAAALIDHLLPFAAARIPLVGLEPSCLLTLRDEALVMGLGDKAKQVASCAVLFEEFVANETKRGRFALKMRSLEKPLLVHGHCHQKAFGTVGTLLEALRLIPNAEPELIESSCCGMAGSFGYEAEHFELSMQMAELSLLPALRRSPDAVVVANGTSCRHQIADGASRKAIHLACLYDSLLVSA